MSIIVNQITKLYGTQKALNRISLEIKPGEVVGLLGPNGAGKSTLMKILSCYLSPTEGEATVCGFNVMEQSMDVRRRVGYLPENNPLYLDMYIKEFLQFIAKIDHDDRQNTDNGKSMKKGGWQRGNSNQRVKEMIALTGLEAEQHKKIGALSRGYRQRVGLAQALIHNPEVLILDEPTSGLDPNQLVEIRHLIQEIGKEKTIMLSTHIMQEVEAICDRTIIIHKGSIVADDTTKNLQQTNASKTIVRIEFNQPVPREKLARIPGVKRISTLEAYPEACSPEQPSVSAHWRFESDTETDIRPVLFQFAVENGLTVLSLQRDEQKLEEVFQELTKN